MGASNNCFALAIICLFDGVAEGDMSVNRELLRKQEEREMQETTREDKVEAIIGICRYDRKLIDALGLLAGDFRSGREKLPSEFLGTVMQGINWTVEVLNQVMDVLNEGDEKIEKQMINDALVAFNDAFTAGDVEQICEVGENFE